MVPEMLRKSGVHHVCRALLEKDIKSAVFKYLKKPGRLKGRS
jgi:hypothetical protein